MKDLLHYEIRIYPSHQLVLNKRVPYVEEVIGEDTVLKNLSHHGKKEFKTEERGVMGVIKEVVLIQ